MRQVGFVSHAHAKVWELLCDGKALCDASPFFAAALRVSLAIYGGFPHSIPSPHSHI